MTARAYLTETGRVVRKVHAPADPGHRRAGHVVDARGDAVIARVEQRVTRYNLRRTLVTREWIVSGVRDSSRATGRTRAEAVDRYLAEHGATS